EAALRELARPSLQLIQTRIQETAQVMELQGSNIRFLDGVECQAPLRVGVRIGVVMPAHCSAGGKALVAALDPGDLQRIYRDGLPPWPTARYTTLEAFTRHLSTVRRLGYGTNLEETEPGVSGVGVTVPDPGGRLRLAFTVAVPTARFDRTNLHRYVTALN